MTRALIVVALVISLMLAATVVSAGGKPGDVTVMGPEDPCCW